MDQEFDDMIRERMNEALDAILKEHTLGALKLPRESGRQRLQRHLGEFLIALGERLRDGSRSTAHSTKWSQGRI